VLKTWGSRFRGLTPGGDLSSGGPPAPRCGLRVSDAVHGVATRLVARRASLSQEVLLGRWDKDCSWNSTVDHWRSELEISGSGMAFEKGQ